MRLVYVDVVKIQINFIVVSVLKFGNLLLI